MKKQKQIFTVCAWCFPGLRIINGIEVTHTCCPVHKWQMELEHLLLTSPWQSWWQAGIGVPGKEFIYRQVV